MVAGNVTNSVTYYYKQLFKVTKCTQPSIVLTNLQVDGTGFTSGSTAVVNNVSEDGFIESRGAANTGSGAFFRSTWTAEAEL